MSATAPGLLSRLPQPPRKVVLVRASRIGDFLCAVPAFRALRRALPEAEITLIGLPFVRDLVRRSPYLDRFEPFPGFPGIADQLFDARHATGFLARMQAEAFDLAVQLHGSGVYANPFTLLLGAKVTAGFVRPQDGPGRLDAALPFPEKLHETRRPLALTSFLGAVAQGEQTDFPLWPEDHAEAELLLRAVKPPLWGVHPSARDRTKRWPPKNFAAAARLLRRRHGGTVVVVGGADERPVAAALAPRVGEPCLDLAGRTALPVLGAVLARLAVLLTNDSGPAHIAYALGTPSVTVFGSTDPARWGPPTSGRHRVLLAEAPCRPCAYEECPIGSPCLTGVTVPQVVAAAEEVFLKASGATLARR